MVLVVVQLSIKLIGGIQMEMDWEVELLIHYVMLPLLLPVQVGMYKFTIQMKLVIQINMIVLELAVEHFQTMVD
jgi:hypothetical protein